MKPYPPHEAVMYKVHKEIGSKPRQPAPRFGSTELPEWLIEIHRREKQSLEARHAAAQARHIGKNDDMVITHEDAPDTDEPEIDTHETDNEAPE